MNIVAMFFKRIPRLIIWIGLVLISFLAVMTIFRFLFYFRFNPPGKTFPFSAFLMGLRFDIKFVSILGLFMLLTSSIPVFNPSKKIWARKIWVILLSLVFTITIFIYLTDYFYYDYLQQRLNASILNYVNDAAISFSMVMASYPVFRMLIVILICSIAAAYLYQKISVKYQLQQTIFKRARAAWYIIAFLLLGLGIFGKIGQFNLRWSDAFSFGDNFKANLSLNPFQSFFSTLNYKNTRPDIKKVRADYSLIANYLGITQPDSVHLNYERNYSYSNRPGNSPNVVLVICESFSMYRSSMSGNPLNTTPYFNELCKNGIFFDRCFTPSYPTARGVWASVTGIPDVLADNNRSASRSPEVVDQQLIMNDFKGYEKFYFLGGDPSWANIKGMLMNNIDSLHLYSQDDFKAKKINVWGIDDKNLFLEANSLLAKQQKPFFAIIQTADNHRPYTIPAEDLDLFKKVQYPNGTLHKYGFEDNDQLNAFRYADFCYEQFFNAARKEKYYSNTVFIFVGDHGVGGNATAMYPASWTEQRLSNYHVPLLFYAPELFKPMLDHNVCSQVDIMPSAASLLRIPYYNNSMGKSLFDTLPGTGHYAFIIDHDTKDIGLVNNQYHYLQNLKTGKVSFVSITGNDPVVSSAKTDSIKDFMVRLTDAYYETSRYLLYNNKRKR